MWVLYQSRFMIHDLQSVCYTFASCQTIPMRAPTYRNSATGGRDVSIVDANNGGRSLPPTRTTCSYLVGTTHKPARWAKKNWDVWTFKGSHCQLTDRVRKWQSTPMHLGCTSTVPGCQGESTSVAIGKLHESSLLHYCWRASQMMHQWWIHFPFIAVTSAVVGTTIWHSSGISNLNIFAGNQTPKIQIQYNLCIFHAHNTRTVI